MHWDPFDGQSPEIPPPPSGAPAGSGKGVVRNAGAVIALLGVVVLIAEMIFFPDVIIDDFPVIGSAVCTLGFVVLFVLGGDPRKELDPRLAEIARANGWSFKPVSQRVRRSRSGTSDTATGGGVKVDPAMRGAYSHLGPLILPRVGDLAPTNPQALMWGQIDGRDLWLGVEEMTALNLPGQDAKAAMQTAMSGQGAIHRFLVGVRLAKALPASGVVDTIAPFKGWEPAGEVDDVLRLTVPADTDEAARQALRAQLGGTAAAKLRDLHERFEGRAMVGNDAVFLSLKDHQHQLSGGDLPSRTRAVVQECAALAEALDMGQA